MKRLIHHCLPGLLLTVLLAGCSKSELTRYDQPGMVYIYKDYFSTSNDSTIYSFAIRPSSLMQDTVKIPIRIMGEAGSSDRTVNVTVVKDSTTATEGKHYKILPVMIKAGEYKSDIKVVLYKTPDLATGDVRLQLAIGESADFKPGLPATMPVNPRAGGSLQYFIKWNDVLTKPSNWDTRLASSFGSYSKVKYLFIIQVTGRAEFPYGISGGLSFPEMNYYNILCKTELATYVAANGPLIDETGATVTFP